jgi:thiol-disulfide isomerase/thioredoxin
LVRRRKPTVFVVVLVGIVGLGAIAIVLSLPQSKPSENGDVTSAVNITGDTLPALVASARDPAIGEPAPEVTGSDLDGNAIRITDDGRPKALLFLAHWCPHCQREVTALTQWLEDNEFPDGVDVYTVSTLVAEERGNYPPKRWLDDAGWPLPVLVDDEESSTAEAFGLAGTPYWVFIEDDGSVAARLSGEIEPDALDGLLEDLEDTR